MTKLTEITIVCNDCGTDLTDEYEYERFYVREFDEFRGSSSNVWYHFCHDCLPSVDPQTRWCNEGDEWQYETVEMSLQKRSGLVTHCYWLVLPPYMDADESEHDVYKGRDSITHTAPEDIHELVGLVEDAHREDSDE